MNKTLKDLLNEGPSPRLRNSRNKEYRRKMNYLSESENPNFEGPKQYNPNSIYILAAPGSYTYKFAIAPIMQYMQYLDMNTRDYAPIIVDWGDGMRDNRSTHKYFNGNEPRVIEIINGIGLVTVVTDAIFDGRIDNDDRLTPFDREYTTGALHMCNVIGSGDDSEYWAPVCGLFDGCKNLTYVSPNFFELCTDRTNFGRVFAGCSSLTSVPDGLFRGCKKADFWETFEGCTNLSTIPNNLFSEVSADQVGDDVVDHTQINYDSLITKSSAPIITDNTEGHQHYKYYDDGLEYHD